MSGAHPAVFGKLPSHGDFVARGLDASARAAWDDWASRGLDAARAALGEGFEAAHDAAPPWRFALGPGRFGPAWRAGAFAPSVDRVGRRYLIIALIDGLEGAAPDLAESCEEALYDAFERDWTVDELLVALPGGIPSDEDDGVSQWWTLGGPIHPPTRLEGVDPPGLLLTALASRVEAHAG